MAADLSAAAAALRRGEVVVVPTDTVYGVAVDPTQPGATERLFAAKRRPRDFTLPVLVADAAQLDGVVAGVSEVAARLIERFWPGGLTVVLARHPSWDVDLGAETATVGVRCPDHAVPVALCREVGPLATTSANLHGSPTPATAGEVALALGAAVAVVVDGGVCAGAPSTVVSCVDGRAIRLVREGRIPWAEVEAALGPPGTPGRFRPN